MWLSVVALLLAADPSPDDAGDVLRRMEQPILKCKTFQADLEVAVAGPDGDSTLKGRLLVTQGNKMRLELDGSVKGKPVKMALVSDGTKMRMTGDTGPGKDLEMPKHLREFALASVTRTGVFAPLFLLIVAQEPGKKPEPFDLDKELSVSDLKLGKKEMVSGKEAQALVYKLTAKGAKEPLAVTVWIDGKTNLPVKRAVTLKQGAETLTVTETYTKATVDGKIGDKEFVLPK
jgi:outer membrane lipoprotein-sorting protein